METPKIEFDQANLFREEAYTDMKTGSIRCLIPVTTSGEIDPSRKTQYALQTQVMTQGGALPVQGAIDAETLEEAVAKFPQAVEEAINRMVEAAQEYQRQEASRIVTPGQVDKGGLII